MAQQTAIKIRRSSVASKIPLTTDLVLGELALNTYDGILYFKKSPGGVDSIVTSVTLDATQTLTNKTLTSPTINSGALSGTFSGNTTLSGVITLSNTTDATNTTTAGTIVSGGLAVAKTIYTDQIRVMNNGNGTNIYVGDDAIIGDVNAANTFSVRGQEDPTQGYIIFGNANNSAYIGRSGSNPITVSGGQLTVTGTATGSSAVALQLNGYTNKGGTGYHDFLSVTNAYGSATNPNKFFRLNSSGNLEIINSAYSSNIFSLTDAGELSVPAFSLAGTFKDSTGSVGTNNQILSSTGTGVKWVTSSAGSSGTVTSVSVVSANGFAGTVANSTTTPAITLTTSITGLLKGNGTSISAATAGTDYLTPTGSGSGLTFASGLSVSSGTINLTNTTTSNQINFGSAGVATPTTTSYSVGTKLVLYDNISSTNTGMGFGIETGYLWSVVNPANGFKWYSGTTNILKLDSNGAVTLTGAINKVTITAPATGSTLTIADGKTLTASNTLTFTGTDGSSVAFGTGGTVLYSSGALGTPSSATLTNATGLPLTTGVTGVLSPANGGTGIANNAASTLTISGNFGTTLTVSGTTSLTLPTSGTVTALGNTVTGSGSIVLATSPTLVTPTLGVASATSINKVTITAPTTGSTLTIADGKTLTVGNTLTFTGTDTSSVAFGAGGTVLYTTSTLTAGNLSGTIPSSVLGNSTVYIGTTAVALNRSSANLALTGISSVALAGSTSGTSTLQAQATAGTTTFTLPTTTGTLIGTGDSATVTNTMLVNPSFYIGTTSVSLGATSGSITSLAVNISGTAANLSGTQTANYVYAAPNGSNGAASFRALVASDIPPISNVAGGTTGAIHYQSGANVTAFLSGNTTTTPQFVTSTGTGSAAQAPTLTGSTGSGSVVLATSPTLVTPALGVANATSVTTSAGLVSTGLFTGTYTDGIILDYDSANSNARISAGAGDGFTFYNSANTTRVSLLTVSSAGAVTLTSDLFGQATQNVFNTVSTTVNFAGAATTVSIGASTGTTTVNNNLTATGTVAANGASGITTTQTTFPLVNTTATTVNFAGAATAVNIGASTGTTTVNNNLTVTGNLDVKGTTTFVESTTVQVSDKNIEIGKVATPTDTTADGGGITLLGSTNKTIIWDSANNNWTSSENWNIASGKTFKINNVSVLSSTTLGSGVTGSSLTSVGTITSGTWQGTVVSPTYGGTGVNNGSSTITVGGNVTYSGAYTQTFTATGNTSVTLPTSGTLSTLAGAETLSNKTLSSVVLTGTVTANGSTGTAGYVLSSTGTGVQWVAQSSGGSASFSPTAGSFDYWVASLIMG